MSIRIDTTRLNPLGVLGAVLAQADETTGAQLPAGSYDEVWNRLMRSCANMIGEDECRHLLGYRPFVCTVIRPARPVTANWWFWAGVGGLAGVVIGKLFQ